MRIGDFARRHCLIATLYVAVAIPGILSSLYAGTSNLSPPAPQDEWRNAQRVLNFDSSFSAGTLYKREPSADLGRRFTRFSEPSLEWVRLGPARGEVVASPHAKIWLELELAGALNPSLLGDLTPDCLYRLSIAPGCPPPDEALFSQIAQFPGLRELDLRHSAISSLDRLDQDRLGHIECMWLRLPEDEEARTQLLDWAARSHFESKRLEASMTIVLYRAVPVPG